MGIKTVRGCVAGVCWFLFSVAGSVAGVWFFVSYFKWYTWVELLVGFFGGGIVGYLLVALPMALMTDRTDRKKTWTTLMVSCFSTAIKGGQAWFADHRLRRLSSPCRVARLHDGWSTLGCSHSTWNMNPRQVIHTPYEKHVPMVGDRVVDADEKRGAGD